MAYRRQNKRHNQNRNHENKKRHSDTSRIYKSKRPSNVTVKPKPGEFPERTIKRFMKKVKKEKVLELHREKTDYFKKPSVIRRRKAIRKQALLKKQKLQEQSK